MIGPILTIVVPCYNEEEVLPETAKQLSAVSGISYLSGCTLLTFCYQPGMPSGGMTARCH
jgi:hypothetical protein